jgi:hypothetical protein
MAGGAAGFIKGGSIGCRGEDGDGGQGKQDSATEHNLGSMYHRTKTRIHTKALERKEKPWRALRSLREICFC